MNATQPEPATIESLADSPRLPVVFVGHGSPMNAIEDNAYRRSWQDLGSKFGVTWPRPQLILCVSAHWLTQGWWLTAMDAPRTIHDFGGFPPELFAQTYPAPGQPAAARELSQRLRQPGSGNALGLDVDAWGLDHGAWSVLKPMFPAADIPVLQLSMDYRRPPAEHLALGAQLRTLRERGVLIVGSGNIVHNLGALRAASGPQDAYDWALAFDAAVADDLQRADLTALANFRQRGTIAQMAHPSHEHFLPLLYTAAAAHADEAPQFFNTSFELGSISMRSVVWG